MKRFKLLLTAVALSASLIAMPIANAQSFDSNRNSACDALQATGTSCDEGESNVTKLLRTALNLFSFVVGIAAVIMIIVAGLRYITSNGDSGAISGAKNAIIYAIVGLIVVAFAQTIVLFVIGKASKAAAVAHPVYTLTRSVQ